MRKCLIIILILIIGMANAAKITVGPANADYAKIQQAVDNATTGDVIEVHSGTYHENVYVFKPVALLGVDTGEGMPLVNADGAGSVITLASNGTTIKGFNVTDSGHCGCGNSGILVDSSDNSVIGNKIYRNKYGIYVKPGMVNNTFLSNDLLENNITSFDNGGNHWDADASAKKVESIMRQNTSLPARGNHYSDYDEPAEGCNDTNKDGFCDLPRKIEGGSGQDNHSSILPVNR
jgi:parallel beta-helix repeat protein